MITSTQMAVKNRMAMGCIINADVGQRWKINLCGSFGDLPPQLI